METRSKKRKLSSNKKENYKKIKKNINTNNESSDNESSDDEPSYDKQSDNESSDDEPSYDKQSDNESSDDEQNNINHNVNDNEINRITTLVKKSIIKTMIDSILENLELKENSDDDEEDPDYKDDVNDTCEKRKVEKINNQKNNDVNLTKNEKLIKLNTDNLKKMKDKSSSEYDKLKKWIDGINKINFNNIINIPVSREDSNTKIKEYFSTASNTMDKCIYGQKKAKNKILEIVAQFISSPTSSGNVIAFCGEKGTGKTSLAKNCLAKALNRPIGFISLGGMTDSYYLHGCGYSYEGAICGKIVDILKETGCMNPIIFFDELDKVSKTPSGQEIIGILTHLTDSTQNDKFLDKYYAGIDFDLSKALFIFSYNYPEDINPILRDRITEVEFDSFSVKEKKKIAIDFLYPNICENINFKKDNIIFNDDTLLHIITKYTNDKGVRGLKKALEDIVMKLNLKQYFNDEKKYNLPITLTNKLVDDLLDSQNKEKNNHSAMMMYM
jgi:ATP-dependent Lon protease